MSCTYPNYHICGALMIAELGERKTRHGRVARRGTTEKTTVENCHPHPLRSKSNKYYLTHLRGILGRAPFHNDTARQLSDTTLSPGPWNKESSRLYRLRVPRAILNHVTDKLCSVRSRPPTQNYTRHACRASWQRGGLTAVPRATPQLDSL